MKVTKNNFCKNMGFRIKELRKSIGPRFTQQNLADRLNDSELAPAGDEMTLTRLKQWELGNNAVAVEWIPALCKELGCDAGYLFGEYPEYKRQVSDLCEITGLSFLAAKQLYQWHENNSGVIVGRSKHDYSFECSEVLSEMIESPKLPTIFHNLCSYLVYAGMIPAEEYTDPVDNMTQSERDKYNAWAQRNGFEVVTRESVCELWLQMACDKLKEMAKDILIKNKGGNDNG